MIKKLIPWLALVIALLGGVPGSIKIWDKLFGTKIIVEFDEKLSFISVILSDQESRLGKPVIGLYRVNLVGKGATATVKEIECYIEVEDKWVNGKRFRIKTSNFGPKTIDDLLLGNTVDSVVLRNWVHFDPKNDLLPSHGKRIRFSLIYLFDIKFEKIKKVKFINFVVRDFLDNSYFYRTEIKKQLFDFYTKNKLLVFDCSLKSPDDAQKILKNRPLDRPLNHNDVKKILKELYDAPDRESVSKQTSALVVNSEAS